MMVNNLFMYLNCMLSKLSSEFSDFSLSLLTLSLIVASESGGYKLTDTEYGSILIL